MGPMADLTPQAFAEKWGKSKLSERSAYQQHFLDLCRMLGQPTPADVDPEGEFYTFEKGVKKTGGSGGKGFADVWRKGFFAFEYKGKHKDLTAAYSQLLLYREDLENPPLLVVTDTDRFEVHTNFTGTAKKVYPFANAELPQEKNLRVLRALFTDPDSLRPGRTTQSITEEAAGKFAILADGLRSRGHDPHQAAHFLNRLLFCLFAEDVGLLEPKGLFTRIVEKTGRDPELFARYASELFGAMASGGNFLLEKIRHFDGGLFEDAEALPLEAGELKVLTEAARLDWQSVEPAIFGTLFERSLDPTQRAKLGAHYTSRDDILAVTEPVLMAPLRREWDEVRARAGAEAEKALAESGRKAQNALRRAEELLYGFAERLRGVRVLDPACGSGNFLYVALKELLDLEKEVSTFAGTIGLTPFFPGVSPDQLYGIETSPYAHELAQVVVWIGYLQWTVDNGFGTRGEPILGPMTNIREMDAILDRTDGQLREPEWPEADVIVGNPPFLGGKRMRTELEDGYVDDLFALYDGRVPREADLVTYWFERSREQIEAGRAKRAGLLATNSIRGGANRRVLQRIRQSGGIFFAESDREWVQNGAAVRVSMVGFDGGKQTERVLDRAPVEEIYADLTGALDLTEAKQLRENLGIAFMGDTKGGPFDIPQDLAKRMLSATGNPNGRPNSDVVRPWANGLDITRRPRGVHIIDFGTEMGLEDAALYEAPFEYVSEHVRPMREKNNRKAYRDRWWIHMEPRPAMRRALTGLARYLATARVAKHRLFVWLSEETLPDSQIIVFSLDDDYSFGVLHSRAHELWARSMGTWMGVGNDLRYTPTTCFETFPFPEPPDEQREEIASATKRLDELRRNWLNPEGASEAELKKRTLTNLYNARPTWLQNAHAALDRAVFSAYGWPEGIGDEEILKNLLALNLERSS